MSHGPSLIFDKSALESLNLDEPCCSIISTDRTSRPCFSSSASLTSKKHQKQKRTRTARRLTCASHTGITILCNRAPYKSAWQRTGPKIRPEPGAGEAAGSVWATRAARRQERHRFLGAARKRKRSRDGYITNFLRSSEDLRSSGAKLSCASTMMTS